MHNPGRSVRGASEISCWSLLREIFSNGILEAAENSKRGLHSVFLRLGFFGEQSHIASRCYLVIGYFLVL